MFNTPINENAPIVEKQQIVINAAPDKVWYILTDINNWPKWQKNISKAVMNGKLKEETTFDWKAGGLSFASKIHTFKPFQHFGWTGKTIGTSAIHNWSFSSHTAGTLLHVEESLEGFLPKLFKKKFSKDLKSGMKNSLHELKEYCEQKL
jgi:hypothetical protein